MEIPKGLEHQSMFFEFAEQLGLKTARKNNAYGDAFQKVSKIMMILYPDGIPIHQYENATLLVRMMDKVCRITNGNQYAFDEDAFDDLCGYALVGKVANYKCHKLKEKGKKK